MSAPVVAAACLALLCAGFELLRRWAVRLDNFGIVDVGWTYGFGLVALAAAAGEDGWAPRRWAAAGLVVCWSARLGTHLLRRVSRLHPREDPRYARLRQDWGGAFPRRMAGFFQLQAASVVLLSLPLFLACRNPKPGFRPAEIAGALIWLAGWLGEALADRQLAAFKADAARAAQVCDAGLWALSRHPNYFFEFVVWVGLAVFASASPLGWIGALSPACILYLLLRVTGIPMAEEQSLRSKGEAYRRYQQRTRAFVPWPRGSRP